MLCSIYLSLLCVDCLLKGDLLGIVVSLGLGPAPLSAPNSDPVYQLAKLQC